MIGSKPARATITILQGADFEAKLKIINPDGSAASLAGSSFAGQIRRTRSSPGLTEQFDVSVDHPTSTVKLSIPRARTSAIAAGEKIRDAESTYVYDVEWTDSRGMTRRILEGALYVSREVTR